MTYKPEYRGTFEALDAESEQAFEWFKEQILSVLDEEDRAEIKTHGWFRINRTVERQNGGYGWSYGGKRKYQDYMHVWKIEHPRKRYGDMRFVIRKDGTLNTDNLRDAASGECSRQISRRRTNDVLGQNLEIWTQHFNVTTREFPDADITLSQYTVGEMTVKLWSHNWDFTIKKTIRIDQLRDFIKWAEGVSNQAKEWGK